MIIDRWGKIIIDMMGQDGLNTHNLRRWSIVHATLSNTSNDGVSKNKAVSSVKTVTKIQFLLPLWVNVHIPQTYLCDGEQEHLFAKVWICLLTRGFKAFNWKVMSYNMRVTQGSQKQCQQIKSNAFFFLFTSNKLLNIIKKVSIKITKKMKMPQIIQ